MKWFLDLATRAKLLLSFGLMTLFLLIVMLVGYQNIAAIQESQRTLADRDFADAVDLLELRVDLNRQRSQVLEMMLKNQRSEQQAIERDLKERAIEIDRRFQRLFERGRDDPGFLAQLDELKSTLAAYRLGRDAQFALIYEG